MLVIWINCCLLDAKVTVPAWSGPVLCRGKSDRETPVYIPVKEKDNIHKSGDFTRTSPGKRKQCSFFNFCIPFEF